MAERRRRFRPDFRILVSVPTIRPTASQPIPMESVVTEIFYRLSTAFFWPVALALLVLFVLSLADLG
ncbi:hypothetical protein P3W85_30300, partial [Cupriavidus basilensis]|nr:hypothetical protein [Cupriavidus basilensis]